MTIFLNEDKIISAHILQSEDKWKIHYRMVEGIRHEEYFNSEEEALKNVYVFEKLFKINPCN